MRYLGSEDGVEHWLIDLSSEADLQPWVDMETVGFPGYSEEDVALTLGLARRAVEDRLQATQCPDDHDVPKPVNRSTRRDRKLRPYRKVVPFWEGGAR